MKKKSGKIIIWFILIILVFLVLAFYLWDRNVTNNMEKVLGDAAADYYEKYVSSNTGSSAYKVTLEDLKEANDNGESYNLTDLADCDAKKTVATVNINYGTGKVVDVTSRLECKKIFK